MPQPTITSAMPLQQRLLTLANTLQFAWFVGHLTLLLTTLRYGLSYIFFNWYSGSARFCYRTAFIAAATTYGIVVYKAYRSRMAKGQAGSPLAMLTDENVQYLLVAIQWLFSRQMPLALLPFSVYSVFHVATYTRGSLLKAFYPPNPQGQAPPKPAIDSALGNFVRNHYDSSMLLVSYLETLLWVRILGAALLFQKGTWILLVTYTIFFRVRYTQSSFVRSALASITVRIDALLANQGTPPVARQVWETTKRLVRQAGDATDVNKYVGGAQPGPKKAQ
jgi:hypothetical protein